MTDTFTVSDLNVGVVIQHSYRGDLTVTLQSPLGTTQTIIDGAGGPTADYNVRLDDESVTPLGTTPQDWTDPYPGVSRQPNSNLSAFDGEAANGTWTMRVCDRFEFDIGTFRQGHLEFTAGAGLDPLVVTNTSDANTIGTLRFAINHANFTSADDAITFNIPGAGPHVIAPTSALPLITDDNVSLDGTTQSGTVCNGTPNATGGMSTRQHQIAILGTNQTAGDLLGISGASNVTIQGLTIGLGVDDGLDADNADGLTLLCNHFGASTATTTDIGNADNGVEISNSDNVSIGDGTLAGLNVFGFNVNAGLEISNSNTGTIERNFFGIGADGLSDIGNGGGGINLADSTGVTIGNGAASGRNVISGNGGHGIEATSTTNLSVSSNYIGTDGTGAIDRGNAFNAIKFNAQSGTTGHTNALIDGNVVSGNDNNGMDISSNNIFSLGVSSSITITNNLIGVAANGTSALGNSQRGIKNTNVPGTILIGGTGAGNTIAHNPGAGVVVESIDGTTTAIIANSIYSNGGLGIDLGSSGITPNDNGDGDTGPNDLLNFPIINSFGANGTTSVSYDFNLDVPSAANGYRVEFFSNSAADSSGHGEGETFLGFVDVAHAGGDLNFTGSFTANETVAIAEIISATATRKTGASSYDITSEFAANQTSTAAINPLVVTNTNDSGAGSLRDAITFANANAAEDSITFNIPGAGPHVISPISALPTLTDPGISLDGTTQAGASCGQLTTGAQHDLRIQIDGTNAGALVQGIEVTASDVTVRGLSITNFDSFGVGVRNGGDNFTGECLHVGVAPDGTTKGPNAKSNNRTPGIRLISLANATIRNSLISGNDDDALDRGLRFESVMGGLIEGNIVGLNAAGTAPLGNSSDGILLDVTTSNITIGGVTPATRNILSGNGRHGIFIDETGSNVTILGNYIGLGLDGSADIGNGGNGIKINDSANINNGDGTAAGRNVISGNGSDGLELSNLTDVEIHGNYIGVTADGLSQVLGAAQGIQILGGSGIDIGDGTAGARNVIAGNDQNGITLQSNVSDVEIYGNYIGVGADGTTAIGNGHRGIWAPDVSDVTIGTVAAGFGNIISNNTRSGLLFSNTATNVEVSGNTIAANDIHGVEVWATASVAIYANEIYDNTLLGIDLQGGTEDINGVSANDSTDGDTGPNDLLNFPVINDLVADGTTTISYDFNLDAPSAANGYRVEFFKNDASDPSGHGEGEVYLGFVEITHAGGGLNFTGSFTASETVDVSDLVTMTATRKTGTAAYDITSEFSLNFTAMAPSTDILVVDDVAEFDPFSQGLYLLPGNDVIRTVTITNAGGAPTSPDAIVLILDIAENTEFYNGDIDDAGPEANAVGFDQSSGGNLSFTYGGDVGFSDSVIKPKVMSDCNYTPSTGYDSAVRFLCLNPKGQLMSGNPNPFVALSYRSRIK